MRGHNICLSADITEIIPNYHQILPFILTSGLLQCLYLGTSSIFGKLMTVIKKRFFMCCFYFFQQDKTYTPYYYRNLFSPFISSQADVPI